MPDREYITTVAQLRDVALAKLGEMKPGTTYQQYMAQAEQVASQ